MKRVRLAVLAASALFLLAATPAPQPSASPSTTASPAPSPAASAEPSPAAADALLAKARAEFEAWQSGKIDLSHYIPEAKATFTDQFVSQLSNQYLKPLGAVKTFTQVRVVTMQGAQVYVYRAACEKASIDEAISWNEVGLVQFIRFIPVP